MSRDDLDNLLRTHLAGELDRQRGRAARAFTQQVTAPMETREAARPMRIGAWRRWAVTGMAMAACMAVGFLLPRVIDRGDETQQIAQEETKPTPKAINADFASLERTTVLQNVDKGAIILESGHPGRRISQQRVERYRWIDPQTNAQYEYVSPSEQDLLIQMHRQ